MVTHHVPPLYDVAWGFCMDESQGGGGLLHGGDLCVTEVDVTGVEQGVAGTRLTWSSTSQRGSGLGSYLVHSLGKSV